MNKDKITRREESRSPVIVTKMIYEEPMLSLRG
jgi:hypothetical protein